MSEDSIIAIVAIGCLFGGPMLWGITSTLAENWRKARADEQAAQLKRELAERGYTADEIIAVVNAGRGKARAGKQKSGAASE